MGLLPTRDIRGYGGEILGRSHHGSPMLGLRQLGAAQADSPRMRDMFVLYASTLQSNARIRCGKHWKMGHSTIFEPPTVPPRTCALVTGLSHSQRAVCPARALSKRRQRLRHGAHALMAGGWIGKAATFTVIAEGAWVLAASIGLRVNGGVDPRAIRFA